MVRSSSVRPSERSEPAAASGRRWRSSGTSGRTCRRRLSCSATPIRSYVWASRNSRAGRPCAGVDGVLALDLPIEEAEEFRETLAASGLDTIFLLSPTTTDERIRKAAALGRGFLYGISRLGVTGARDQVSSGAETLVRRIRALTSMPVALGFGISRPEHVAEVGRLRGRRGGRERAGVVDRGRRRVGAACRSRRSLRAIVAGRMSATGESAKLKVAKFKGQRARGKVNADA